MQSLLSVRFGCHNLPLAARRSQLCELCVRSLTLRQLIVLLDLLLLLHCANDAIGEGIGSVGWGRFGSHLNKQTNYFFIFKGKHALVFKRFFGVVGKFCFGKSPHKDTFSGDCCRSCRSRKREGDDFAISFLAFLFSFCLCLRTVRCPQCFGHLWVETCNLQLQICLLRRFVRHLAGGLQPTRVW